MGSRREVCFDADRLEIRFGGEVEESLRWQDLQRVEMLTTDEGPFTDDMFWVLTRRDGSHMFIPSEFAQPFGVLERLQQLPGFDNEQVIAAATSVENARFLLWERDWSPQ